MTYLLDTHALLWALTAPTKLGRSARRVLADPTTTVYASAASAWEIATKHRIGKLPQADALLVGYTGYLQQMPVLELPVRSPHALVAGSLGWAHRDPFDRMLAAQCLVDSLTLLSRDVVFDEVRGLRRSW